MSLYLRSTADKPSFMSLRSDEDKIQTGTISLSGNISIGALMSGEKSSAGKVFLVGSVMVGLSVSSTFGTLANGTVSISYNDRYRYPKITYSGGQ